MKCIFGRMKWNKRQPTKWYLIIIRWRNDSFFRLLYDWSRNGMRKISIWKIIVSLIICVALSFILNIYLLCGVCCVYTKHIEFKFLKWYRKCGFYLTLVVSCMHKNTFTHHAHNLITCEWPFSVKLEYAFLWMNEKLLPYILPICIFLNAASNALKEPNLNIYT